KTKKESVALLGLLIVVDADLDPTAQFKMASEALEANGFPKPTKPFSIEVHNGLRVAVFIIPGKDRTGTLEHILVEAAFRKNPKMGKCLDEFADCTGVIPTATENQQAKMKMSSLAAAYCIGNPWASDAMLWHSKGNPVPIDSDLFHPLVDFIQ